MSTKTLRKRIALVAVATLGAGVLSVAPAHAGTPTITVGTVAVGTTGVVTAATGSLNAQTMTITSAGKVGITLAAGTGGEGILTVSGGTITPAVGTTLETGVTGPNAAGTSFVFGDTTPVVVITPNAGATSVVVKSFDTTALYTAGTSHDKLTISVVATTSIGALDASYSFANLHTSAVGSSTTYTDTTGANSRTNGQYGYIDWSINDANANNMPSSTVVTASATNGALVSFSSGAGAISTSATTTGTDGTIYIAQPVENAPVTTTVTISVNGAVWTSKTMTITGDVASIKVVNYTAGRYATSGTSTGVTLAYAYDSAGNQVARTISAVGSRYDSVVSGTSATIATSATTYATGSYTCASRGSANIQYYIVNTALKTILSPVVAVTCSSDPYTYTASLDKASYKPGEIATLTITAKDSKGNLTNGVATLGTTDEYAVTISGAQMTPVTTPTTVDTFSDALGQKVYKFTVGTTEGSYNMVVDLPKWTVAGNGAGEAVTVAYAIASGSTAVSNADVLKAIVSLIASINKQIAALQKALLKR
jgi:YD repeat-containing protein